MREFAEQEVILPDGPYEGRRYRVHRQPFAALWFDEVESGRWNRINTTGPSQSGKTLLGSIIPLMYHLFEIQENLIFGLPSMEMAGDKWQEDIKPAIEASKYREYLPTRGAGSQGGTPEAIRFTNGTTLKFMTGGGSDKKRAGFTARVLVVTETDGMDESGGNSREADKITQLETRTNAHGSNRRIYMECTVSIEEGRTWTELKQGTDSRIVLPCPHCGLWVSPEREHLNGWQDAEDVVGAREGAAFCCPECGGDWTEGHREEANRKAKLVHRGQEVTPEGEIVGEPPRTDTLGFRWSAVNNLFVPAPDIGAKEWKAQRAENEENAEKELRQFWWAIPHEPETVDLSDISAPAITRQTAEWERGRVPDWCERLTLGMDLGKWLCHWCLVAWRMDGTGHIVDYGREEVPSREYAEERALLITLRQFKDACEEGWLWKDDQRLKPDQVWIDAGSGTHTDTVFAFVKEAGQHYRPIKGRGAGQYSQGQYREGQYREPKTTGTVVLHIGDGYHFARIEGRSAPLVEVNVDRWKTFAHQRLATPDGEAGRLTLFQANPNDHLGFAKHMASERQVEEFDPKRGTYTRWESVNKNNHWLDALTYACAAGHAVDVRVVDGRQSRQLRKERPKREPLRGPGGVPYLVTQR